MKTILRCIYIISSLFLITYSHADIVSPSKKTFVLPDNINEPENISAIEQFGPFLIIGSDEAVGDNFNNNIQLLKQDSSHRFQLHSTVTLFKGNKHDGKEMDIEGLAVNDNVIYVIGSHSSKRKKIIPKESYKNNRKNFKASKIEDEINRDWLYRLTLDEHGKVLSKERITLRNIIQNNKNLKLFSSIPGKENGIDIEGIAVNKEWLYIGFRGPVFRDNYVPILKLKFDDPKNTNRLLYVQLNGGGIRGMTRVSDGFLLLSGPVGSSLQPYQLFHWNGKDVIPGVDRASEKLGKVRLLSEIVTPEEAKAEGILVTKEDKKEYHIILTFDGAKDKNDIMKSYRIKK